MITVIGDLVVDIIVKKGKTNYGTDTKGMIHFKPGGQANNVAAYISREGIECTLIGKVGNDPFGEFLIQKSIKSGVQPKISKVDQDKTGSIIVMINENNGERSMISDRGANLTLNDKDIPNDLEADLIYLSGYSFFDENTRTAAFKAKNQAQMMEKMIALDPSSIFFLKEHKKEFLSFMRGITFFFPNYEEGVLLTSQSEPFEIIKKLKSIVKYPILTLGDQGCIYWDGKSIKHIPALKVEAIDTTGAGDSFVAGFLAAYQKKQDINQSIKHAIELSSTVVTSIGAHSF
ncbi:carbohydrate kinase family protein [Virgibacillus proomii]|uniref:carbohydrate kinase family protein n=1 Tax=Virgibacillus proomii TaxID=84407 RepID=UPI001C12177D|nr:carbohydrate kinase family protein [Virgibacillus proomii]MBU5266837.1 carbohydrate kinase family protein [Virgibacillus proomii]